MKTKLLIAAGLLCGVSLPAMAQDANDNARVQRSCDRLEQLAQENEGRFRDEWIDRANEVAREDDPQECIRYVRQAERALEESDNRAAEADGSDRANQQQEARSGDTDRQQRAQADTESRIVVEQPQPHVTVQQDAPEITYTQPRPEVSVNQGRPEIIVRQQEPTIRVQMPRPTITVEQPDPEIIVRMPEPEVSVNVPQPDIDVAQEQPEVQVEQRRPQVDVQLEQPEVSIDRNEQAQVEIERGQAVVRRQQQGRNQQQARIDIQREQPHVRFERANPRIVYEQPGEPEVRVNRSGEPTVRYEQMEDQASARQRSDGEQASSERDTQQQAAAMDRDNQRQTSADRNTQQRTDENQSVARQTTQNAQDGEQTASIDRERVPERTRQMLRDEDGQDDPAETANVTQMRVSDLVGRDVLNRRGQELGSVERVVTRNGRTYVILSHGGFLGLGQTEVALPLDRISSIPNDDELVMRGLSEEDIDAMPEFDSSDARELRSNQQVEISES